MNSESFFDRAEWFLLVVLLVAVLALGISGRLTFSSDMGSSSGGVELQLDEVAEEVRDIREDASRNLAQVEAILERLEALERRLEDLECMLSEKEAPPAEKTYPLREHLGEASREAVVEVGP